MVIGTRVELPATLAQMLLYAQGMADALNKLVYVWRNPDGTLQAGDERPLFLSVLQVLTPHKDVER
jgi:hypothetical protein